MNIKPIVSKNEMSRLDTNGIRESFLIESLFLPDQLSLHYLEDRMIVGGAILKEKTLLLEDHGFFANSFFLENREVALVNLSGDALIEVDGQTFTLKHLDTLYIGRGYRMVKLMAKNVAFPAKIYIVSTIAEIQHPIKLMSFSELNANQLGQTQDANMRKLYKIIYPGGIKSSRLMLGMTFLEPGSVWNTMPPHTHQKRMETYLYFNLPLDQIVCHLMGEPQATRHVIVKNEELVISPSYSIHSGVGTQAYAFIWCMSGENQSFDDMQKVMAKDLK
jgi:4-deoxy-L-threo-5-hexosulose-uronate ketol-isomerase